MKTGYSTIRPFISTPVVFTEGEQDLRRRDDSHGLYRAGCGVARRRRSSNAAARDAARANVRFSGDGVTTWRDAAGTRWLLTPSSGTSSRSSGR